MDHAERQFAEKGYEGTSIREIADKADINISIIYYHFKSKELLYRTLFSARLSELNDALRLNRTDWAGNNFEKLNSYIAVYIKKIRENFYFHRLLNVEIFSFRDLFFKENIKDCVKKNTSIIRKVMEEGIARKEFRLVDIDLFLMTLFHLLHQVIGKSPLMSEILDLEEIPEEQMLDRINDFLYSLLVPANRKDHALITHKYNNAPSI